ncbi:cytochrome b5 [Papiliotrema laurentii]|uniref:Cytochrome b5 n=1 Tax=Papiliotrema laurentii TaxID=5418 RepID=A0AAD9L7F2_PAPLA|nr:cytochrome b5 [Papiliotrema laurentii]
MTWLDTLTSTPVLIAGALGISAAVYAKRQSASPVTPAPVQSTSRTAQSTMEQKKDGSVMSPPAANLELPKDDPISVAELRQYDGTDPSKPIYVAIKGRVFDVSHKKEMYGKGTGYNVFAGKDASKGLGMSSLDPKDAVADYSGLNEAQMKTLDQWESFFEKRYNIVGKVVP